MFDVYRAEYGTVGCVLLDSGCLDTVRGILPSGEVFLNAACRDAYAAMCAMVDGGEAVDVVTVGQRAGLEDRFLAECMELAPSAALAETYAKTVLQGHRRRLLGQLGDRLQADSLRAGQDLEQLLEEARSTLARLDENSGDSPAMTPGDSLVAFFDFRAGISEGKNKPIRTGFPALDSMLGGFARGGLYVMAARPGVGKSALGIAVADMVARKHRVLYVSLEMTAEELNARRVAAVSQAALSYGRLLFDVTSPEEDAALAQACSLLSERSLYIHAPASMTVAQLAVLTRRVAAEVVVVDYLGLLSGADPRQSEYERITQISGELKRLAKARGCVVIALCQLNREAAAPGPEQRPRLSQLRSSGAIEQDADGVLLLHRPETEAEPGPEAARDFFVDIAKNRHGRTGAIKLSWFPRANRFEDRSGKWPVKSWQ